MPKIDRPQCVVCFGAPLSGVTSAIRMLHEASTMPTQIIYGVDPRDISAARKHIAAGTTVFIDDFEPTIENVQSVHDSRLVAPDHGTLVRIWSDDETILTRAYVSGRDDVDRDYLKEFRENLLPVEDHIRKLASSYRTIPNGMMFEHTVRHLAEIARITR